MYIPTMAIKITAKNYPVAVACLPGAFATFSRDIVIGNYLVINKLSAMPTKDRGTIAYLGNTWLAEEIFRRQYKFINKETSNFGEVEKI